MNSETKILVKYIIGGMIVGGFSFYYIVVWVYPLPQKFLLFLGAAIGGFISYFIGKRAIEHNIKNIFSKNLAEINWRLGDVNWRLVLVSSFVVSLAAIIRYVFTYTECEEMGCLLFGFDVVFWSFLAALSATLLGLALNFLHRVFKSNGIMNFILIFIITSFLSFVGMMYFSS